MNIVLKRFRIRPETIDGHIYIDGQKVCDCAENAHHCLKAGTYPLNVVKCKQHGRKMPVLSASTDLKCAKCKVLECVTNNSTMPRFCPMLCPGNGVYNRKDGSIILGTYLTHGCLTHPKQAFTDFYERIRKSIERGHELTITIIENYPPPPSTELTNFQMGERILSQF